MDSFWTVLISIIGAVTALGSMLAIFYKSRRETSVASDMNKAALDARIDARLGSQLEESWARIDDLANKVETLERNDSLRNGAITRILRDIARQWPNSEGPLLNPADIEVISETVPSSWIRNHR